MPRTILLVDDKTHTLTHYRRILEQYGFEVLAAGSGEKAVETAVGRPDIDLVLIDIELGGAAVGADAAEQILARQELPIVFLTDRTEKKYTERAGQIVNYGYVLKSSGENVLVQRIESALRLFGSLCRKGEDVERYRLAAENTSDVIAGFDAQFRPFYISPSIEELTGYTPAAFEEKSVFDLLHPDDRQELMAQIEESRRTDRSRSTSTFRILTKSGREKVVEVTAKLLYHHDGTLEKTIVVARDITARREAEEKFSRYIRHAPHGLIVADTAGEIMEVNPATAGITGYTEEELRGMNIRSFVSPETSPHIPEYIARVFQTGSFSIDLAIQRKEGALRWLRVSAVQLSPERMMIFGEDVSERRTYEQLNEERKRYAQAILQASPHAIITLDTENRITEWNPGAEAIFHYHRKEVIGRDLGSVLAPADQDSAQEIRAHIEQVNAGHPVLFSELVRYTKEGQPVTVIAAAAPILVGENFSGVVATYTTIDELKRREREVVTLLQEKEQLLREVHHRIKNHMSTIYSIVSLQASYLEDPDSQAVLDEVLDKMRIMHNIYQTLYTGESVESVHLSPFLHALIRDIEASYIREGTVHIHPAIEEITVTARQSLPIGIIMTELITNAVKYAFSGGEEGRIEVQVRMSDTSMLEIEVCDNGVGVPEKLTRGEGFGFGLILVQGYVDQYEGELQIENDSGSRCVVSLPLYEVTT